jgi:hypothetical protein
MNVAGLRAMSQVTRGSHADIQLRGAPAALHRLWQLLGPAGQARKLRLA